MGPQRRNIFKINRVKRVLEEAGAAGSGTPLLSEIFRGRDLAFCAPRLKDAFFFFFLPAKGTSSAAGSEVTPPGCLQESPVVGRGAKQGAGRGVLGCRRAPQDTPELLHPHRWAGAVLRPIPPWAAPLHPSLPSPAASDQGDALGRGDGGRIRPGGLPPCFPNADGQNPSAGDDPGGCPGRRCPPCPARWQSAPHPKTLKRAKRGGRSRPQFCPCCVLPHRRAPRAALGPRRQPRLQRSARYLPLLPTPSKFN